MEKDQYLLHDVTARCNEKIVLLIAAHRAAGYGVYWMLLEYLRMQHGYRGSMKVIGMLAAQMGTTVAKLKDIISGFGLFVVEDDVFYSPGMCGRMKKLDEKRAKLSASGRKGGQANKLKNRGDIASQAKAVEESKAEESRVLSISTYDGGDGSKSAAAAVTPLGKPDRLKPYEGWETYIDRLAHEEVWLDLVAIHSGMKERFMREVPLVLQFFKEHVRSLGKESHIMDLSDAKNYLYNVLIPGNPAYSKLIAYLDSHKPVDIYRFERRDAKGNRSYCGVSIPTYAPPRPNDRSNWDDERKVWS